MSIPDKIIELVDRFERNIDAYKQGKYKETQVRREFIDPFFKALGWDVDNERGYAEAYKEVVHEDAIKVGWGTKAPDYSFRIGSVRKFFVEAKKPSIDIKGDIHPAFQVRRYAWSAKLPLSILTDFEEFAVYDTRIKPNKNDKASNARVMYLTFREYQEKWEEIASIFSRDSILKGSFDKYVESKKKKRGTAEVDDAFLSEIESWRDMLARNIALRNSQLENRVLNDVVQKTIDRILFLRICEDRGVENYGQLMALLNGANIYSRLSKLFLRADERYNSGLFHFSSEKNRQDPDEISLQLSIDDKHLKDIIKRLYYPESPYEFSVLPADILGQVYERFLGKVIRLTPGHRAVVEEKPEVRKAGGVYYTPTYIVDYIVKNTVGKLLEGKTPKQVEKLKILDPACGSGSFLLGAYQYLMDWYLKEYTADDPEKYLKSRSPKIYQIRSGDWRLSTTEKKRILLNNIYGVDIDTQAVEVTKLSLLLKVLEGETDETLKSQLKLFHERALPDLGNNIKCGNSLIGSDFYEGRQLSILTEDEIYRINAFDWEKEFPEVRSEIWSEPSVSAHASTQLTYSKNSKTGGFDAVIGNPPWGSEIQKVLLSYIRERYLTAQGELDSYVLFIEKSLSLLRSDCPYGVILPDTWLTLINASKLRRWILEDYTIVDVVALNESVFTGATVDPLVIVIRKQRPADNHLVSVRIAPKKLKLQDFNVLDAGHGYRQGNWLDGGACQIKIHITAEMDSIVGKIHSASSTLETFFDYRAGCKPYEVGKGTPPQTKSTLKQKPFTAHTRFTTDWKMLIRGNDVQRYLVSIKKPEWIKYGKWLAAPRDPEIFKGSRILIQAIRNPSLKNRIVAAFTTEEMIARINVYALIKKENVSIHYLYILGVLNSRLMNWFLMKDYGLHTYVITGVLQLPIRVINFADPADKSRHDKMVALVEQMLDLNKRLALVQGQHEKTLLKRQIEATDRQIDKLVYELYELTEEEIRLIEETVDK
ncbi:MAG: N-6 DNA methylase [Candidatus Marinimicrobia bacterium]|nr:N-6 DNA methylase [Candidatus Neomarinimicrobiota bacterium]